MLLFGWVMLAWQSTSVLFVAPGIWSLILYGMQFLILWAGFICLRQTGLAEFLGTDLKREHRPSALITTGCYAIVRHPLYLLGILFLLLNPVITTRWIALTVFSIPYLLFGALLEERRMLRHLGPIYSSYQREVPFLIPRLNRQISVD
jgi:protein-S-isoprenylcysteine O-methyltransferase Ste14